MLQGVGYFYLTVWFAGAFCCIDLLRVPYKGSGTRDRRRQQVTPAVNNPTEMRCRLVISTDEMKAIEVRGIACMSVLTETIIQVERYRIVEHWQRAREREKTTRGVYSTTRLRYTCLELTVLTLIRLTGLKVSTQLCKLRGQLLNLQNVRTFEDVALAYLCEEDG